VYRAAPAVTASSIPTDPLATMLSREPIVAKVGRNQACPCGSGRKAKRCCGVQRGPDEESLARAYLAHAAGEAAGLLAGVSEVELVSLLGRLADLPRQDLSLQLELPKLVSPELARLCGAVADDDEDAAEDSLRHVLETIDTPLERARLAKAAVALRTAGSLDVRLAAAALIDLASGSRELLCASLLEAIAVRVGATRTPGGIVLAAA
jgi:hypothetical protein